MLSFYWSIKKGRLFEFLFDSNEFSQNDLKIHDHRSKMDVENRKYQSIITTKANGTVNNENRGNMDKFGMDEKFKYMDLRMDAMESMFLLKNEELEHKLKQMMSLFKNPGNF